MLDPTLAYGANPGQEERIDHPHDDGDDCTWLRLDAGLAAALYGGDPQLPARSLPTTPPGRPRAPPAARGRRPRRRR